jgi:hypothetical protein
MFGPYLRGVSHDGVRVDQPPEGRCCRPSSPAADASPSACARRLGHVPRSHLRARHDRPRCARVRGRGVRWPAPAPSTAASEQRRDHLDGSDVSGGPGGRGTRRRGRCRKSPPRGLHGCAGTARADRRCPAPLPGRSPVSPEHGGRPFGCVTPPFYGVSQRDLVPPRADGRRCYHRRLAALRGRTTKVPLPDPASSARSGPRAARLEPGGGVR